jgi:hypothetical protein
VTYAVYLAQERFNPRRLSDAEFRAFHRAENDRMLAEAGADLETRSALLVLRSLARGLSPMLRATRR